MKKKVLVIAPRIPFPLDAGGKIAIYSAIAGLSEKFEILLFIITDEKVTEEQNIAMKEISKECHIVYRSKLLCSLYSLKSFFNLLPLQTNYFYSNSLNEKVKEILPEVDVCYSFMIRTSEYFKNTSKPKIINYIDSLYLSYKRSAEKTTSLLWKLIYKFELYTLFKYENKCLGSFNTNLFVNSIEASFWQKKYNNVLGLQFGIDDEILNYKSSSIRDKNAIVFLGKMNYQPNIDAVIWFCDNVLPKLNENITFFVIGPYPVKKIIDLEKKHKNIKITGFLKDPYGIMQQSLSVVAPMQTGGGIQSKILVAMGLGSKVIATKWVIAPIQGAVDRENIFEANTPENYLNIINLLFDSHNQYDFIGYNAKELALKNFSWTNYKRENIRLVEELI
jgi:glycosyltransferase involved in cell wall biosynthesis